MDLSKPYSWSIFIMKLLFWLPFGSSPYQKAIYYILFISLRTLTILSGIGSLTIIIIILKNNADLDIKEALADVLGLIGCNFMCGAFYYYKKDWADLTRKIISFECFGTPPSYRKTVKKMNILSFFLINYAVVGIAWYCLVSYLNFDACEEGTIRTGIDVGCGMINPTWLPIARLTNKQFWFFFVLQVISILAYLPSNLALCIFIWETVEITVCRIDHLKILFRRMFNDKDSEICWRNMKYCLEYHQNILSLTQTLSYLTRWTTGSFYFTSAFIIATLYSLATKETVPKATFYCAGYLLATFILCHAGQRLFDETANLNSSVYDSKWYKQDVKLMKNIVFMSMRCQKPVKSLRVPTGEYNYLAYSVLMKTAYSFIALLNQI